MRKRLLPAIVVTALFGIYVWAVGGRALDLISTGDTVGILLGLGALILPTLSAILLLREWQLAVAVQRMADHLAREDELPLDELPRSPGGRIDRAAADTAFLPAREGAEAEPTNWRAWYNLAFAYDAAGDRRRARGALRTAAKLFREREARPSFKRSGGP